MLNVNEIFYSIQGEGTRAGLPCVFVRLQGCTLRCVWCDTPYALDKRVVGTMVGMDELLTTIKQYNCSFIEFTGGEPLEQPEMLPIAAMLCDMGYTVAIETGGHIAIDNVDPRIIKIVDFKAPDSKMVSLNNYNNIQALSTIDEVKFVLASERDYQWAKQLVEEHNLASRCAAVLFSSVFDSLPFVTLVEWILRDRLPVRFQLQLHKFVWHPETRGV
jgi:7-carboxy-7-deazaguanine synthase